MLTSNVWFRAWLKTVEVLRGTGGHRKDQRVGPPLVGEGRDGAAWEEGVKVNIGPPPRLHRRLPGAGRMSLLPWRLEPRARLGLLRGLPLPPA